MARATALLAQHRGKAMVYVVYDDVTLVITGIGAMNDVSFFHVFRRRTLNPQTCARPCR